MNCREVNVCCFAYHLKFMKEQKQIHIIIVLANRFYVKNIVMIQIIKDYQTVTTVKLMEIALI